MAEISPNREHWRAQSERRIASRAERGEQTKPASAICNFWIKNKAGPFLGIFDAAIFWTSLNPAAPRRDEPAFDDQ
jgi:hypothetical protein